MVQVGKWPLIAKALRDSNKTMGKGIVFGLLVLLSPVAWGQVFTGAATEALGGAGRAAVMPLESHYLNPAAVAFLKSSMYVGGAYQSLRGSIANPESTTAITIADSSSERIVSGGFGYVNKRQSSPAGIINDQDFSLSLSAKVIPTVGLGLSTRRLVRQNSNGPSWAKHNAGFGLLVVPIPVLGFSFTAHDMINDDALDMVPVLGLGTHVIIMDIVRFRADVSRQEKLNPEKKGTLNIGMEIDPGYGFQIRTGGWWDGLANQTYWTGGLAWIGPNLSLAYGVRNNVNVTGDTAHTFQAWLVF
ncbi:MAG: hypothetical protein IT289_02910 [Oligoflexia bacterium]|nr:hypothetical protein [Oligoflexia bacterium]